MSAARPKRPFGVTVLLGLVLMFTGLQLLRAWVAVANWGSLQSLPLQIDPLYFPVSGLVWAAAGAVVTFALWTGKRWAPRVASWGAAAFAAFFWFDHLWLQQPGPQGSNLPFLAVVTLALLGSIFGILAPANMQAYFGVNDG
jgi:hypothetical protein